MIVATNPRTSWSKSLEDLIYDEGPRVHKMQRALEFSPRRMKSSRGYDTLAAVLVVSSSATRNFQRVLFEALELLEKSTGAFKVALFTEAGSEEISKDFDWPIEHCFSERDWWSLSDRNWLDMAAARVDWASQMYGASFVFVARSVREAVRELASLGAFLNLDKVTVSAAQAHLEWNAPKTAHCVHPWLRGWLDDLPAGDSEHRVESEPFSEIRLSVTKRNEGMVLVTDERTGYGLLDRASEQGWSIVTMCAASSEPLESGPGGALRRAVVSGFGPSFQVVQSLGVASDRWDPTLGLAGIARSSEGAWQLDASGGFKVARNSDEDIIRAAENLSKAHLAALAFE